MVGVLGDGIIESIDGKEKEKIKRMADIFLDWIGLDRISLMSAIVQLLYSKTWSMGIKSCMHVSRLHE